MTITQRTIWTAAALVVVTLAVTPWRWTQSVESIPVAPSNSARRAGESVATGLPTGQDSVDQARHSRKIQATHSPARRVGRESFAAAPQEPEFWRGRRDGGRRGEFDRFREPTAFVPDWTIEPEFERDVFTFARVKYTSSYRARTYGRRIYDWRTDHPDADNNFTYRLHELTSLRVDPQPVVVSFDQPEIFDYPFVYLVEAGGMSLTDGEVEGMRKYLSRGGFLMIDDFWEDWAFENLLENLQRVFPGKVPVELPMDHEIFHIVYDINEKPIIPSIHSYYRGYATDFPSATEAHYMGLFDDDGRMMAVICHNTDLGDGWEREGVEEGYFRAYSERWAYPLGINIVTYAMTH